MANEDDRRDLCERLAKGPAVLFLGQGYLGLQNGGKDPYLHAIGEKYALAPVSSYHDLLGRWPSRDRERLFSTLQNISQRIAVPDWLDAAAKVSWNAVITSAFDEVMERALRDDWRRVDPIWNSKREPEDPRDRSNLHVFKLFGSVTSNRPDEQPPVDDVSLMERGRDAAAMLDRIPSLVTPMGVLAIEGFGSDDWLGIRDLTRHIAALGEGQAHWFSAAPALQATREVSSLVKRGKLVLHEESLAMSVAWGLDAGLLSAVPEGRHSQGNFALTLRKDGGRETFTFTPAEWRKLTQELTVLDDDLLAPPAPFVSDEERYQAFRLFLYGSHGTPRWMDYAHHFPFRREVFAYLVREVRDRLVDSNLKPEPLIVHGQSGVGKSVALADLAFQMKQEAWPVLYFAKGQKRIDFRRIDAACQGIEKLQNTSALIVVDGPLETQDYERIADYLASRGRKALVVGSSYRPGPRSLNIEFPARMSAEDQGRFVKHLAAIEGRLVERIGPRMLSDRHFLASLYYTLPETRANLRVGLIREYEIAEQNLDAATLPQEAGEPRDQGPGPLGKLLERAYGERFPHLFVGSSQTKVREPFEDEPARMAHLTGLVLVPGRYGHDVPVDLLMRCLGNDGYHSLRTALEVTDIFRWVEDDRSNPLVGSRLALEAEIIVNMRWTPKDEINFVNELLTNVRVVGHWTQPNQEVSFALDLLRSIGPNGPYFHRFKDNFDDIVAALTELRTRGKKLHPRLLQHEGHLRRERIRELNESFEKRGYAPAEAEMEDILERLRVAEEVLVKAESLYTASSETRQRHESALSNLYTEMASLRGTAQSAHQQLLRLRGGKPAPELERSLEEDYEEAIRYCNLAAHSRAENYYQIDVRFWVTRNRLENEPVSSPRRLDLAADLCEIMEDEVWQGQAKLYQERMFQLGGILGDEALKGEALRKLDKMGSMAGHYLQIRSLVYGKDRQYRDKKSLIQALDYLRDLGPRALDDLRVLRLYCRTWWQAYGNPDLFGEGKDRLTAALLPEQWREYAALLKKRLGFEEEENNPFARFSYAWALFQCERFREAIEEFRSLDQMTLSGKHRVRRLATWCDSAGRPIPCNGKVREVYQNAERGVVYCPQVRSEIDFLPKDFAQADVKREDPLDDFHIAFNFRGVIADPNRFYR